MMVSWNVLGRLWPVFAVALVFVLLALMLQASFTEGMKRADERWEKETAEASAVWARRVRDIEQAAQEEQRRIAEDYQRERESLEKVQKDEISEILNSSGEDLRHAFNLVRTVRDESDSGLCKCPGDDGRAGLSKGAETGGSVACYAKDRLLRQVAESVAIGQECDREMTRFKALIEACRK